MAEFLDNNREYENERTASGYFQAVLKKFPKAKFILTITDSRTWYRDMSRTHMVDMELRSTWPSCFLYWITGWYRSMTKNHDLDPDVLESCIKGEAYAVRYYIEWVQDARATVPKENLFLFRVTDGWKPLCDFLNLEIPDEEFPDENDADDVLNFVSTMKISSWICVAIGTVGLGIAMTSYFDVCCSTA